MTCITVRNFFGLFDDKTLIHYKSYIDGNLEEESTAYLYPTSHTVLKYRLTGNLIKTTVEMDSIVRHGLTTKYEDNGDYSSIKYNSGQEISVTYFDNNGTEISEQKFLSRHLTIGPCGTVQGEYFINGKKKRKKK